MPLSKTRRAIAGQLKRIRDGNNRRLKRAFRRENILARRIPSGRHEKLHRGDIALGQRARSPHLCPSGVHPAHDAGARRHAVAHLHVCSGEPQAFFRQSVNVRRGVGQLAAEGANRVGAQVVDRDDQHVQRLGGRGGRSEQGE